mmetsp:Transcript_34548/g.103510  ORF Transcript_34548/g.103510 Transcript_34548/m.103510 type:complete len:2592 (+) Transcript_34548:5875-13650(+)
MRDLATMPDTNPKWIILDGDLDANWIENMNSVMDDNRLLTLASNERIRLLGHMRMIFEIRDLAFASPATVTRAGILFISEAVLLELRMNYKHMLPNLLDFGLVQALCNLLDDLLVVENVGVAGAEHFEIYFVLACVWAFGGAMSITSGVDYRKKFSQYWKDTWKTVKFPHRGEVFDCFVDQTKHEFTPWTEIVPEIAFDSATTPMGQVTVPTSETVAISYWLDNLIKNKHGAMLVGGAGCGKTAIINGKLRLLPEEYSAELVNINYYTNANMFQKILEAPLEKKAGKNYGPPGNKKLIYFVDDLNMAALDAYNTASNISLMRQHVDYGHIYDLNKLQQKVLLNTQYLAAMNPTAGSFIVNPRLQRRFNTFAINFPSGECLNSIYSTFLLGHLSKFNEEVKELGKRIVQAGLMLHKRVSATFRKTASNFHYEFNIRHMAGVFQGLLNANPAQFGDPLKMGQLWLHESERIYGDRLVSKEDLKKYKELAAEQAKKFFKEMSPTTLMAEPLIFCHFAGGVGEKCYDRCPTFNDLSGLLNGALDEYNEQNAVMNLVLFEDAMRHVARISRIIESPGGHALLVGVGGSGKQSLARLATFVSGYSAFQVVITARYGVNDLKADLQVMYRKAGLKGEGISFIFTDQQIADERFLVFMNDLLSSGNIPGLFPAEDMDDIINGVRPAVKRAGLPDTRSSCWDYFIQQVVQNLHVILCFSPIGDPIKVRTRRFPALVNCVVIDWFQPWPEEALVSVSNRFLSDVDLGDDDVRLAVSNFMPYSFLAVNEKSEEYARVERRYNYTTPKSFLELIALFKSMLADRRKQTETAITRLSNGVLKLESTAKSVGQLEEDLKVKSVEVEEKKAACDAMIPKLEEEKAKATEEAAKANVIAADATEKEVSVTKLKAEIERDLAAAEPALVKASAALDGLDKKDLGELKSLGKPPGGVDDVTAAVIYMLHPTGKGKIDTSWKAAQVMMKDVNGFLNTLMGYKDRIDEGSIPKNNFKLLAPLLELEHFNMDTMKKKSNAAAGLCDFVININVYWNINENVEPMRLKALEATETLEKAIAAKEAALAAKAEAEATVAELTAQFNAAVKEKEDVIAEADMCERKLGLAQRLINALSSEGARWKQGIEDLNQEMGLLVGDVLLASAFVSYIGCFNKRFRLDLMSGVFVPYMQGKAAGASFTTIKNAFALPMSEAADPLKVLTNDAEIASWNNETLPADKVSIQNGAIVTNCARWPLMIDPQLQGIKWIKKHEEANGLKTCRLGQKSTLQVIGSGVENGAPVLLENIQLQIDAVLNPVIGRQTVKRGRNLVVKLGDKEIDYSPKFRLYLQTKLANPHYPPEIQAETTLVNFMVTEDGLEDQLLALTVSKERPDLSQQSAALLKQQNEFKIKIKELEDGILYQLATAEGDVTENIELIENLEDSKRVSIEVAEKMVIAKETAVKIEQASELYRPVANRGSLMFFLLSDLFKIHSFHHYSLASFNIVFERAVTGKRPNALEWDAEETMKEMLPEMKREKFIADLEAAEAAAAAASGGDDIDMDALQKRLDFLVERITFNVFAYARRGLLEKHKLIVATMLILRVKQRMGEIPAAEAEYLITGRAAPNPPQMTAKVSDYLQEMQWAAACGLKEVAAFKTLPDDLELDPDAWKEWVEHPKPELEDLPGEWGAKCTAFQKLLVLRALRTDRVTSAVTRYIVQEMGERYMSQPTFDMDDTFADSTFATPLFFVLFPGVDPGVDIENLGAKLGYTEANQQYVSISMGQGQEKNAENVLDRFTADGGWVFLQNVHLMQSWLPILERKLEIAAEVGHKNFRCFLSAEPPPLPDMQTVPEGIMQSSIKVANEPPTDIKSNLRSALSLFSQETFEKSTKPVFHRPMLLGLCFFHALCLGRRKFGFMGFSRQYPYNNGDLTVCAAVLQNYLEANEQTPWQDVRYIAGEIMYGGHITDPWDRRVTNTYLEVLLNPDLTDEKSRFQLAPGFAPLLEGSFEDYRQYIEVASPPESPILFGMHPNAEISLLISLCNNLFFTILSVSGGGGGGGGGPARISYERYCKTLAGSFSRTFEKGAYVFKEGDPVDAFFVITSGACEVRVAGPDGKERLIATLGAGDFFGETGLLEGRSVRAASVFATAPLEVLAIDRKVFNEVASVHNSSALSTSMRERAEARQRARLLKVFENMSVSLSQRRRFGKGAVVYQQGSPAQLFYIVNEGELEMSVNKPDGGSVRVKTLRPGDHLGYDAIFSEVHDTTVTCLSEVELTEVTKEVLGDAFSNDRYFSTIFEARQQLREGQLAAASQGEAQILPMMARAAAAGDGVDYSQYESLIKEMAPLEVSHGEAIFQQGDPPEQVYFVSEGQLECEYDPKLDSRAKKRRPSGEAVVGRDGKPRVVATLGPGDHFGETAMLEARKARNLTVRCVTASCVLRAMSMARFSEILRQRPELHFTVQRAAQMRTNQRIRNVVASAADEDLRVVSFAPGETIFRQGDPSDSFYVLESGEVEMSLVPASEEDEPSAPVPVRTCTAGETFGASGLLPGDNVRRNTATALSPVVVKVMPVKLFKAMVREDGFLQAGLKASGSYVEARAVSELDETLDAEVQKAMAR